MKHANEDLKKIQKQLKLDVEKLEERIAPWGNGHHHSGYGSGTGGGRTKNESTN